MQIIINRYRSYVLEGVDKNVCNFKAMLLNSAYTSNNWTDKQIKIDTSLKIICIQEVYVTLTIIHQTKKGLLCVPVCVCAVYWVVGCACVEVSTSGDNNSSISTISVHFLKNQLLIHIKLCILHIDHTSQH